jgi:hypothetical protein
MLLVPKQLRRAGMTGNVPYYGGRFTPAQAYAASHPSWRQPGPPTSGPGTMGVGLGRAAVPGPGQPVPPASSASGQEDALLALRHLLDTGVITPEEYHGLCARVTA